MLKVWSTSEREVTVRLLDLEVTAQLTFGDGTDPVSVNPATGFVQHVYAQAGAYTVTLKSGTKVLAVDRVFTRSGDAPAVAWAPGSDNPNFIDFTWNDVPEDLVSTYDIVWGDGEPNAVVTAPSGFVKAHGYAAGDYTVKIFDRQARRWGQYDITVHDKTYNPDLTVAQGASRYEAVATISRIETPGKEVKVWWGDGLDPDIIANAQLGDQVRHTYDFDDTYMVQIAYSDGTGEGGASFIEIPWPPKGVKPTSRIEWSPENSKPLGIRAKWWGSGWNYTMHWGDGQSERVRWQDAPTPHEYARPGAYTVTAVSDLHAEWTASAQVTVRSTLEVGASFGLVAPGSNQVRASLAGVDAPVLYQVAWGDNVVTEHGAGDLEPVHEYAWGTPAPAITVRDVPAKRLGRFTGPKIPDKPDPPQDRPRWWWTDRSRDDDYDYTTLHVSGLKVGAAWKVYGGSLGYEEHGSGTVAASGQVDLDVTLWYPGSTIGMQWRCVTLVATSGGGEQRVHVPYWTHHESGTVYLAYDWDADRPDWIELQVFMPETGTYTVDWGDGTTGQIISDGLVARAEHRVPGPGSRYTVTVTAPSGKVGELTLGRGTNEWYSWNGSDWLDFMYGSSAPPFHHRNFVPARQDWGEGTGPILDPPLPSSLNDGSKKVVVGRIYNQRFNGQTMTATSYAPWTSPVSKTVKVSKGAQVRLDRTDPWIKTVQGSGFDPGEELTVRFQPTQLGYWANGDPHQYVYETVVTADGAGSFVTDPYRYLGSGMWRAGGVRRSDGTSLYFNTPWQSREELLVTYDYAALNGRIVRPQVDPVMPRGRYRIDWGDRSPVETVTADHMGLPVWHFYPGEGPYRMTVTDPEGREGSRLLYRPSFYVARSQFSKTQINLEQWGVVDEEYYCPVKVDWTGADMQVWATHLHKPRGKTIVSYSYGPGTVTVRAAMPLALEPDQWTFEIPQVKGAPVGPGMRDGDQVDAAGWWQLGEIWDGGRSGQIRIENTFGMGLRRWGASFTLPEGARVKDVWGPVEAGYAEIAPGRWEVLVFGEVDPAREGGVSVRIEHPGITQVTPSNVMATGWTETTSTGA